MPTGLCYYCNQEVEMKSLKRCGACKAVTYCSKDCQKQAWKLTHKLTCSPSSLPAGEEALMKPNAKIVSAWQNEWRGTLDTLAIAALDLDNNPGMNTTHCMWLEFKYTGRESNSKKFTIVCAAIRTAEEIIAMAPHLNIMVDSPALAGKQVRYAMVFYFEEKGKPTQTLFRVRSLAVLGKGLASAPPFRGKPAGWGTVNAALLQFFGSPGEPVLVVDTPTDR